MFERLFSLLLHAKSGVFAGVFLIGTTGALVTATVQNGVTTITLTEASPSPTGSASPSPSASASASPSATASHSASPTASPTGSSALLRSSLTSSPSDCKSMFQAAADASKTVETAYEKYRTLLAQYGRGTLTDAQKKALSDAQKLLTQIRTAAEKAIRASTTCFKRDDDKMEQGDHEDGDENDKDDGDKNNEQKGEHEDKPRMTPPAGTDTFRPVLTLPTPTPKTTPSLVTGTDPKTIADNAVLAMKLVFDTATAGLPAPTTTLSRSPKPSRSPELKTTTTNGHNGKDGNGKDGHGKGDD